MKASLTTLDAAHSAAASEKWLQQRSSVIGTELCPLHQTGTELLGKVHFVYLCRRDVFALLKSQLETLSQSCDVVIAE